MKKFFIASLLFLNPVLAENPRPPFYDEQENTQPDLVEDYGSETGSIIADEIERWSGQSFYAYMFYGEKSLDDTDFLDELCTILAGQNFYVALYIDYASENLYKLVVSLAPFEDGELYDPNKNFEDYCIDATDEQTRDVLLEFQQSVDDWNLTTPFSFDCTGATFFIEGDDQNLLPLFAKAYAKACAQNRSLYIRLYPLEEDPSVISTIDFSLEEKEGFVAYCANAPLKHYDPSQNIQEPASKKRRI